MKHQEKPELTLPGIKQEIAVKVIDMYHNFADRHQVKPQDLVNFSDLAHVLQIIDQCYEDIQKNGTVMLDRFGCAKKNPSVDILKDFQNQKTAIMREYGLTERSDAQLQKLSSGYIQGEETEFERSLHELM